MSIDSAASLPSFAVSVTDNGGGPLLRVSAETEPGTSPREYEFPGCDQDAYADLFAKLSADFSTRLPKNRRPRKDRPSDPRLEPLLTCPIEPTKILYGYGDPWVLKANGEYVLVVTSNDAPNSFPILTSRDLHDWQLNGFAFQNGKKPEWAAEGLNIADYWAPEIHRIGQRFVLCFSARQHNKELAIGFAESKSATGPFVALPGPVKGGGVIDAHLFTEGDEAFLFWKEDNNDRWPSTLCSLLNQSPDVIPAMFDSPEDRRTAALYSSLWPAIETLAPMERFFALQVLIEATVANYAEVKRRLITWAKSDRGKAASQTVAQILEAMKTPVHGQRLLADTLELTGDPFRVIENDQEWEGPLIEGMCLTRVGDKYFLFYSGNDFSTADYGVGYAVADRVEGPYVKNMAEPLLRSTDEWWGPGHPSIAEDLSGVPTLFMHAYPKGNAAYKSFRALLAARLNFLGDHVEIAE